mmetsp:Transcript_37079/g.118911  ORF Transcript_37079/g.118911 Transcript_37079/m.118911 type:complete len:226 (+) Transcript_37079:1847-2524(+)
MARRLHCCSASPASTGRLHPRCAPTSTPRASFRAVSRSGRCPASVPRRTSTLPASCASRLPTVRRSRSRWTRPASTRKHTPRPEPCSRQLASARALLASSRAAAGDLPRVTARASVRSLLLLPPAVAPPLLAAGGRRWSSFFATRSCAATRANNSRRRRNSWRAHRVPSPTCARATCSSTPSSRTPPRLAFSSTWVSVRTGSSTLPSSRSAAAAAPSRQLARASV